MAWKLNPSAAGMWGPGGCPASVQMQAAYPDDETSPKRREGDAAAFYMTRAVMGNAPAVGSLAPNGHPVTQEMVDCAYDILRDIADTHRSCPAAGVRVEEPMNAPETVHPLNDGRPDVYILDFAGKRAHLWEYKYGHRYVDAYLNWQCLDYLAMILECNGVPVTEWPLWRCTVTIAQPRNYHPDGPLREWHFSGAQLVEYVQKLAYAATLTQVENPMMQTGDHCRDCSARHACPALERASMRLVDLAYSGQPVNLPPAALGLELRIISAAIKRLGARREGLEEELLAMAKRGEPTPHWRAEYSKGREKWSDSFTTDQIAQIGEFYGVDLKKPAQLITPVQARKAGVDPAALEGFTTTPTGAMTLVPFDQEDIARRFG